MFFHSIITGHPKRALRQLKGVRTLKKTSLPLRLHLGCGRRRLDGFVNIDRNWSAATDVVCNIEELPCPSGSVEHIETYHVIEHISHTRARSLVASWYDMLIPGGTVICECPDFDATIQEYASGNDSRLLNIFGRQRFPGDAHLWGYNAARLSALFERGGFMDIVVSPGTDYHTESEPCLRLECSKPHDTPTSKTLDRRLQET